MKYTESALSRRAKYIDTLRALEERVIECRSQQTMLVDAAMHEGATWRGIGEALGITGQAAWERYRKRPPLRILPGQGALPIDYGEEGSNKETP